MKGVYALVIEVKCDLTVNVGALGELRFDTGNWVYVGSAMGAGSTNLENRLRRHFRSQKAIHWHIDYLLNAGAVSEVAVVGESATPKECNLAMMLTGHQSFTQGPIGFGASDCKSKCKTHLFSYSGSRPLVHLLEEMLGMLDVEARILSKEDMSLKAAKTEMA
jgi:Uri superfamily endonuclease